MLFADPVPPGPLALLPGELLGILLVLLRGKMLRWDSLLTKPAFGKTFRVIVILLTTNVISNIVFNSDRLLLKSLMGGTAVTIYYLSSLLGKTMSLVTTPLNSVIVGYLVRYQGNLTKKLLYLLALGCALATVLATAACTVASHILIPILYPQEYEMVRSYFIPANLTQVVYFVSSVVTVILLRFGNTKYQLYINVVYAVTFCVLCIPATFQYGIPGFCGALLLTSFIRLGYAFGICFHIVKSSKKQ